MQLFILKFVYLPLLPCNLIFFNYNLKYYKIKHFFVKIGLKNWSQNLEFIACKISSVAIANWPIVPMRHKFRYLIYDSDAIKDRLSSNLSVT